MHYTCDHMPYTCFLLKHTLILAPAHHARDDHAHFTAVVGPATSRMRSATSRATSRNMVVHTSATSRDVALHVIPHFLITPFQSFVSCIQQLPHSTRSCQFLHQNGSWKGLQAPLVSDCVNSLIQLTNLAFNRL